MQDDMILEKKYFSAWILAIFFALAAPSGVAYAGTLSCSVTTAAGCTGTIILRMSSTSNAHAELPSQANAAYATNVICCTGVTGLGNSCTGTFAKVVGLSSTTNAHVQDKSLSTYANQACISVSSGSVSVGTTTSTCTAAGFDTTLGSMFAGTNSHVGNGTAYTTKICGTATGASPPTLTSYTNSTDATLNWAAACTGCGARIGSGAGFRQTVVITGTTFGADPGVGNRSTATNNVKVGTHQIVDANVTAWSATSITFLTDSAVTGDADSDWGANFGGASALTVTAGGAASAGLNFYVFPQVTGVRPCDTAGFPQSINGREYDATDAGCPNGLTDGEVFIDGTRFGSGSTGGSVTIVSTAAGITSWANTLIRAQVPVAIADTVYTGNLAMTQGTGSNNKTHMYTTTGFRVLPRITGFTPTSATYGDAVTVNGNHFCENGGTCPTVFGVNDKVTFTSSVAATVFTSWTSVAMATQVPTGAATGNVVLTSNTFASNGKSFTVVSPTPSDPTALNQYKNSALTTAIAVGASASSTPIYLTMSMVTGVSGGTLFPQIEYKAIGTAFACTGTSACASATEGTGVAGPGPVDCAVAANACSISITPADGVYHWQARVRHNKTGVDYYSNWVSFGANLESDTDVKIDTIAPAITAVSSGTPGSNTATITWSTLGETSTSRVEYNTSGTFTGGYDCAGTGECTALADTSPTVFSHSVALSNLNSGTTYFYRVRSKDAAGNEATSTNNSFATASVTQPAKTTRTTIVSSPSAITVATSTYFTALAPETTPKIKSAYVEVVGLVSGGTSPIALGVNNVATSSYAVSAANPTLYRFLYKITDQATDPTPEATLNLNDAAPCTNGIAAAAPCNRLSIDVPAGMTFSILSARFIMTYGYTP